MSDDVPDFLKDDLLGLESPQGGRKNPQANTVPSVPSTANNEILFGGFPNNNLSLFTGSPFYSPSSSDHSSVPSTDPMPPKDFVRTNKSI